MWKSLKSLLFIFVAVLFATGLYAFPVQAANDLPPGAKADRILVEKSLHQMTLMRGGKPLKTYAVSLGRGGTAPKLEQGDNKVPEGLYHVASRNAHSEFHLALKLSYPAPRDIEAARKRGVRAGGDIMIHGLRNDLGWLGPLHRWMDWTKGCIAVTDAEMDEIWRAVPDGTAVEIRP